MTVHRRTPARRGRSRSLVVGLAAVLGVNGVAAVPIVKREVLAHEINTPGYKAKYGHWDVIDLPADVQVNAVHAVLLPTGKILITAGSGNERAQFDAGTFKTLLYDPASGSTKLIFTPTDMFCGGQAALADGRILIAGGTQRYELLPPNVTHAGGVMTISNFSPQRRIIPKGTEFVSYGHRYRADADTVLLAAQKKRGANGQVVVVPDVQTVFVEADVAGTGEVVDTPTEFAIVGLTGPDATTIRSTAQRIGLTRQDYQGSRYSWIFDPTTERYTRTGDLQVKRWYPTLTTLADGSVLAVSGLDGNGQLTRNTKVAEVFDPHTDSWRMKPGLSGAFPTYPSFYQTATPGVLFFSGANSGYGGKDSQKSPGFWNLSTNAFTTVPGLRDADMLETSASSWVGPVQNQRLILVGGGGAGDSAMSTRRIDTIDLKEASPRYTPGPSLPNPTRYPNLVTLPDDTTLITGGSRYYRGESGSDYHTAVIYHADTNTLSKAASPHVGRNYHTEALLLPDGRVIVMGSNPLYSTSHNTGPARFEKRLEIYTPAYLYRGARPRVTSAPAAATLGTTMSVTTPDGARVVSARLIRPAATTHASNVDQRSVALTIARTAIGLRLTLPSSAAIAPPGYYMLFLVDRDGVPSTANWVHVT